MITEAYCHFSFIDKIAAKLTWISKDVFWHCVKQSNNIHCEDVEDVFWQWLSKYSLTITQACSLQIYWNIRQKQESWLDVIHENFPKLQVIY